MKLTVALSDIHGCFYTMVRLLNQCPKGAKLVFGGDLIDRGPRSRKVVEFAMENKIPTVAANHDDMCLAFYGRKARCAEHYDRDVWLSNGGFEAVRNWPTVDKRGRSEREISRDKAVGGCVPNDVLDWMESLPAYLYPSDEVDENGRRLCCSHTGYGLDADKGNWLRALWGRYQHGDGEFMYEEGTGKPMDDGLYRVLGHSPVKEAVVTEKWANIDSGAAYAARGYGNLTAFIWPTKQLVVQQYDESPVEPNFSIQNGCIV